MKWDAQLAAESGMSARASAGKEKGGGEENKIGRLRPGRVVMHSRYGRGVVTERTGAGAGAEIKVAFKTAGIRAFKAALAKLTPVD